MPRGEDAFNRGRALSGARFFSRPGAVTDWDGAAKAFQQAADAGHPGGCYYLGRCFKYGLGVEQHDGDAKRWMAAAAERGHIGAANFSATGTAAVPAAQPDFRRRVSRHSRHDRGGDGGLPSSPSGRGDAVVARPERARPAPHHRASFGSPRAPESHQTTAHAATERRLKSMLSHRKTINSVALIEERIGLLDKDLRVKRDVVHQWRRSVRDTLDVHTRLVSAQWVKRASRAIRLSFKAILCCVHGRRRKRHVLGQAVRKMEHSAVSAAFEGWCVTVVHSRKLRMSLDAALARLHNRVMWVHVRVWASHTSDMAQSRLKVQQMLSRWRLQNVLVAWNSWRSSVSGNVARRRVLAKAVQKMHHGALSAAFDGWCSFIDAAAQHLEQEQATLRKALLRMQKMALAGSFASWSAHASSALECRVKVQRMLSRWRLQSVLVTWSAWRKFVSTSWSQSCLILQVLHDVDSRVLSMSFQTWSMVLSVRRARWLQLSQVMVTQSRVVAVQDDMRAHKEHVASAFRHRICRLLLRDCMLEWSKAVHLKTVMRAIVHHKKSALSSTPWDSLFPERAAANSARAEHFPAPRGSPIVDRFVERSERCARSLNSSSSSDHGHRCRLLAHPLLALGERFKEHSMPGRTGHAQARWSTCVVSCVGWKKWRPL